MEHYLPLTMSHQGSSGRAAAYSQWNIDLLENTERGLKQYVISESKKITILGSEINIRQRVRLPKI